MLGWDGTEVGISRAGTGSAGWPCSLMCETRVGCVACHARCLQTGKSARRGRGTLQWLRMFQGEEGAASEWRTAGDAGRAHHHESLVHRS